MVEWHNSYIALDSEFGGYGFESRYDAGLFIFPNAVHICLKIMLSVLKLSPSNRLISINDVTFKTRNPNFTSWGETGFESNKWLASKDFTWVLLFHVLLF